MASNIIYDLAYNTHYHLQRYVDDYDSRIGGSEISPWDLCGACGVASYALYRLYKKYRIKSKFVMGQFADFAGCHCWVQVNKKIVDITVTQFDIETPVLIVPANDDRYIIEKVGKEALMDFKEWPIDQRISTHKEFITHLLETL